MKNQIILIERIKQTFVEIRGYKVTVYEYIAGIYGTTTKQMNQAIRRNKDSYQNDFMFQVTEVEKYKVVTICDHLAKLKFSP